MVDVVDILQSELGQNLKQNKLLRDLVSIKVGGVADFFYPATDIEELTHAISLAYRLKIPYFILGGGYNIILSDAGFPGIVIKNESSNIIFSPDFSTVIVDSGANLGRLINLAAGRDLGGFEFLFGVPGTVGGAIYGNAGANGYEIGDFVKSLTLAMPKEDGITIVKHGSEWMNFSYRSSKLKSEYKDSEYKPLILTATLQLVQRRKDEILRLMQGNLSLKKKSQPLNENSAGCFFKNPDSGTENSAGYLLEQSGVKRLRVGGAVFSKAHANFLVNKKNAKSGDIYELAMLAKEAVRDKFNIELEEEIEYIGRW